MSPPSQALAQTRAWPLAVRVGAQSWDFRARDCWEEREELEGSRQIQKRVLVTRVTKILGRAPRWAERDNTQIS